MIFSLLIIVTSIFLTLGILLLIIAVKQKNKLGIPEGKIIYVDTKDTPGFILYAKSLSLLGKPDFIVKKGKTIIPIEKKTCKTPSQPYKNHIAQLFAYCLLIEEHFGVRPPYGIIKYPEGQFTIDYDANIAEHEIRNLVTELLENKKKGKERYYLLRNAVLCHKCRENNRCRERLRKVDRSF